MFTSRNPLCQSTILQRTRTGILLLRQGEREKAKLRIRSKMAESQRDIPAIQADVKVGGQVGQGGNGTVEKTLSWYRVDIGDKLSDQAKKLLEEYSGIPPEEIERHIYAVVRTASTLLNSTQHTLLHLLHLNLLQCASH